MSLRLERYCSVVQVPTQVWDSLAPRLHYHQGDIGDDESYKRLEALLSGLDAEHNTLGNRLYYLATPPDVYDTIIEQYNSLINHRPSPRSRRARLQAPSRGSAGPASVVSPTCCRGRLAGSKGDSAQ